MKPAKDVLAAIAAAEVDAHGLRITDQLDPNLWGRVKAVLTAAGFGWVSATQSYQLTPGKSAEAVRAVILARGVTRPRDKGFVPTPPEVIATLVDLADLDSTHVVLEPSAGLGAIVEAIAADVAAVDCVEISEFNAGVLRDSGLAREVTCTDFLAVPPRPVYDRVLMNPPFAKSADVAHVRHALRFLRPGGRLVAVMSPGAEYTGMPAVWFKSQVAASYGAVFDLRPGAFKKHGTGVESIVAVIPAANEDGTVDTVEAEPEDPREPDSARQATVYPRAGTSGNPVRVRHCGFDTRRSAPGAYVRFDPAWQRDRVFRCVGLCPGCGERVWGHDDGDENWAGPFGMDTAALVYAWGWEIPGVWICARCSNSASGNRKATQAVRRHPRFRELVRAVRLGDMLAAAAISAVIMRRSGCEPGAPASPAAEVTQQAPEVPRPRRVKPARRTQPTVPAQVGERAETVGRAVEMMEQLGLFDVA